METSSDSPRKQPHAPASAGAEVRLASDASVVRGTSQEEPDGVTEGAGATATTTASTSASVAGRVFGGKPRPAETASSSNLPFKKPRLEGATG